MSLFFSFSAIVKETSADSEVSSKVSISQAAFSSSAMNLSGANDGFEMLNKIHSKMPKKCLRHLLSALQQLRLQGIGKLSPTFIWHFVVDFAQQFAGNCSLSRLHTRPRPFSFSRL